MSTVYVCIQCWELKYRQQTHTQKVLTIWTLQRQFPWRQGGNRCICGAPLQLAGTAWLCSAPSRTTRWTVAVSPHHTASSAAGGHKTTNNVLTASFNGKCWRRISTASLAAGGHKTTNNVLTASFSGKCWHRISTASSAAGGHKLTMFLEHL